MTMTMTMALAVTVTMTGLFTVAARLLIARPWMPVRVMLVDPGDVVIIPPVAVVPLMMVIPVAIGSIPGGVMPGPLGMVLPDPLWMVFVPPVGIVPVMVVVPVAEFMMLIRTQCTRRHPGQNRGRHDYYE